MTERELFIMAFGFGFGVLFVSMFWLAAYLDLKDRKDIRREVFEDIEEWEESV